MFLEIILLIITPMILILGPAIITLIIEYIRNKM